MAASELKHTNAFISIYDKINDTVRKMLAITTNEKSMNYYIPAIKTDRYTEESALHLIKLVKMTLNTKYMRHGIHVNIMAERLVPFEWYCHDFAGNEYLAKCYTLNGVTVVIEAVDALAL